MPFRRVILVAICWSWSFCSLFAQTPWVKNEMPLRASALLDNLAAQRSALLREPLTEEVRFLQRQLFRLDDLHRSSGEPKGKEASIAILKGEWNAARHALASASANGISAWQRGAVAFSDGLFGQAAEHFSKIGAMNGNWTSSAALWAARSQIKAWHHPNTALADLVAAREAKLAAGASLKPDILIDMLWSYYLLREDDRLLSKAEAWFPLLAEDPRLMYVYALGLIRAQRLEEAHGALAQAINLGANHPQVSQTYVSVCLQLKRTSEAVQEQMAADQLWGEGLASFTAPVDWYSCTPEQIVSRAGADRTIERLDKAQKQLEFVGEPFQALAFEVRGDLVWSRGNATEAADLYQRAALAEPLLMTARLKRVLALIELGQFSPAFSEYLTMADWALLPQGHHAMARMRAQFPELWQNLGDLFALALYEALQEGSIDSTNPSHLRTASAVAYALFNFDRAEQYALKARRLGANDPDLLTLEALAHYRSAEMAQRPLKEAEIQNLLDTLTPIAEKETSALIEYVCARLNEARRREEQARIHWQRALAEKGTDPVVLFANVQIALKKDEVGKALTLLEQLLQREFETNTAAVARRRYLNLLSRNQARETER